MEINNLLKLRKDPRIKKAKIHINPEPYWQGILSVALSIAILGFAFGFYLFNKINGDFGILGEGDSTSVQTIRKDRLEEVLKYFAERKIKSNEVINNPSPIVDPSL